MPGFQRPVIRLRRGLLPPSGSPTGHLYHNPVPGALRLAILAFLLAFAAMLLFVFSPGSLGFSRDEYVNSEVYSFKKLEISSTYLRLKVTDGLLVPTYRGNEVSGAVLLGTGSFILDLPAEVADKVATELGTAATTGSAAPSDTFKTAYLPLTYQKLEALKEDANVEKGVDPGQAADLARRVVEQNKVGGGAVRLFGVTRQFRAAQEETVVLYADKLGQVRLVEAERSMLSFAGGLVAGSGGQAGSAPQPAGPAEHVFTFTNPAARTSFFHLGRVTQGNVVLSVLIFAAMAALLFFLVFILTIDVEAPAIADPGPLVDNHWAILGLIGADIALLTAVHFLRAGRLAQAAPGILVAAGAVALLYQAGRHRRRHPWAVAVSFLGLTKANLWRSLFTGLALGALSVTAGAVAFPSGVQALTLVQFAGAVGWAFVAVGLGRAGFYHGYVQSFLSLRLGPRQAVWATAAISGLAYMVPRLATAGALSLPLLLETIVVVPVTTALNAYLFQRTRNLAGPMLSRSLLEFLPTVLKY